MVLHNNVVVFRLLWLATGGKGCWRSREQFRFVSRHVQHKCNGVRALLGVPDCRWISAAGNLLDKLCVASTVRAIVGAGHISGQIASWIRGVCLLLLLSSQAAK
jgi:hypothetical protein